MSDDLVVIFVLFGVETERYLVPMGFAELGNGSGRNVALIAADRFLFMGEDGDIQDVDIVLLPDSDLTNESEQSRSLRRYIDLKHRILIAYHSGSKHKKQQERVLSGVFGEKLASAVYVHSNVGSVYDLLLEIAQCKDSQDKRLYQNALGRLVALFPYTLELDARLELLHLCLTPEGAALIISDELPDRIPLGVRQKISELTKIETDGRTIGEMIRELADPDADPFDESEGGYIKRLEAIRNALLESSPAAESPESLSNLQDSTDLSEG